MDETTNSMKSDDSVISGNEVTDQTEAIGTQVEETAEASVTVAEAAVSSEAAPEVVQELSRKEKKQLKKAQKKEKKIQKKLAKKERKKRWKETKKEDRRKLKEHYKDAPWFIRIPRLALRPAVKVLFWGLVATLVISLIVQGIKLAEYADIGLALLHQNTYADDQWRRQNLPCEVLLLLR